MTIAGMRSDWTCLVPADGRDAWVGTAAVEAEDLRWAFLSAVTAGSGFAGHTD